MTEDAVRSTTIYQRTAKDVLIGILGGIANFFKLMARNRIGFVGFLIIVLYFAISFLGPTFIPADNKTKIDRIFEPPSWQHPLGMDHQGRDVFSGNAVGEGDKERSGLPDCILHAAGHRYNHSSLGCALHCYRIRYCKSQNAINTGACQSDDQHRASGFP